MIAFTFAFKLSFPTSHPLLIYFSSILVHSRTRKVENDHLKLTSAMLLLSFLENQIQRKPSASCVYRNNRCLQEVFFLRFTFL